MNEEHKYTWKTIDPRNRSGIILHRLGMFGDYCRYSNHIRKDKLDETIAKGIRNVLFSFGMIPISGETCTIIVDRVDFLENQCKFLTKRIEELETELDRPA